MLFVLQLYFFLVGYHYERRTRRQVILSRGFRILSYFMGVYWFFFLRANFAAPPFIRLLGELSIFISLIFLGKFILFVLGFIRFFVAAYCIFVYRNIFHGISYKHLGFAVEVDFYFFVLNFHLIPLIFFVLKLDFFFLKFLSN